MVYKFGGVSFLGIGYIGWSQVTIDQRCLVDNWVIYEL